MQKWLGMPIQASTHAAEIDQMTVLVHWLMLVLFVGWGAFFVFVLFRFRTRRQSRRRATPARKASSRRAPKSPSRSSRSCCWSFYAIPAWATRVDGVSVGERSGGRPRRRRAVCVEHALSRAPTAGSAAPTSSWCPPTIRSASIAPTRTPRTTSPTINQLNLPVDRPVLVHLSSKDVIHSFGLYRDAREAGRDSRHGDPGLVHPEPRRRVRDRLLAAVRPGPLPDARLRHRADRRRITRSGSTIRRRNCGRRQRLRPLRKSQVSS